MFCFVLLFMNVKLIVFDLLYPQTCFIIVGLFKLALGTELHVNLQVNINRSIKHILHYFNNMLFCLYLYQGTVQLVNIGLNINTMFSSLVLGVAFSFVSSELVMWNSMYLPKYLYKMRVVGISGLNHFTVLHFFLWVHCLRQK